MREKVGKSRNTVFFQWFGAPEGRKVGSLSGGCGASWPDERWKIARVVARSTFASQNAQNTWVSDRFWKLRCRKSARRCGAKHISKWTCTKHLSVGPRLEVAMSKKWKTVVARSTFPSENVQNTRFSDHFWKLRCRKSARRCGAKHISKSKCTNTHNVRTTFGPSELVSRGRCKGLCTLSKVSKTWGFRRISKNDGRRGTFEEDLQTCIF